MVESGGFPPALRFIIVPVPETAHELHRTDE
jgi:hypothetical protein